MANWTVAGVQMDCRLGDAAVNLAAVRSRLGEAARRGARLVVFPECVLTGYGFESKEEAWGYAEAVPGPATASVGEDCRRLGVWAVFGLLERDGGRLFNTCALVGPEGFMASYRKLHLPCLGVDRFTTPGDRPPAVHDLGGLRVGMNICYDAGFPESTRVLALMGADLVVLPTNWPPGALSTVKYIVPARALENNIYFLAVNRVGEERGFRFIGLSRLVDPKGELAVASTGASEEMLVGEVDPGAARAKRIVFIPGRHEVDRIGHRRPEMYGPLAARGPGGGA